MRLQPEQQLQVECVQWMKRHLSKQVVFFHVPNGGKRGMREAVIFKAMGVVAGVPDLIVTWPGVIAAIEMKAGRGRASPEQIAMQDRLKACGWHVAEARSLSDFQSILIGLGAPMA
jgi:hypothetical protein